MGLSRNNLIDSVNDNLRGLLKKTYKKYSISE